MRHLDEAVKTSLKNAVAAMRLYCDQADRAIEGSDRTPLKRIEQVGHAMALGMVDVHRGIRLALTECDKSATY